MPSPDRPATHDEALDAIYARARRLRRRRRARRAGPVLAAVLVLGAATFGATSLTGDDRPTRTETASPAIDGRADDGDDGVDAVTTTRPAGRSDRGGGPGGGRSDMTDGSAPRPAGVVVTPTTRQRGAPPVSLRPATTTPAPAATPAPTTIPSDTTPETSPPQTTPPTSDPPTTEDPRPITSTIPSG